MMSDETGGAAPAASTGTAPAATTGTISRAERRRLERERGRQDKKKRKHQLPFWQELPILILVAVGLALLIKTFLVQAFYIPSESMETTLQVRDRVLVNKLVYRFRDVHHGEVIVFNGVDSWTPEADAPEPSNPVSRVLRDISSALGFGPPSEKDFIKRVIGLPGDTVLCCDAQGRVTVNGKPLDEPYVYDNSPIATRSFGPVKVPSGRLWVMGDHRGVSADSRSHIEDRWQGTIAEDHVVGRAFVIVWPLSRMGGLPVPETFKTVAGGRAPGRVPAALPVLLDVAVVLPVGCRLAARRRTELLRALGRRRDPGRPAGRGRRIRW